MMNLPNQFNLEDYYKKQGFNENQIRQIQKGLEKGLDVSSYADLKYDWIQMYQIRVGLENKVDVSIYADPQISSFKMLEKRLELENKDTISMRIYNAIQDNWKKND